MNTKAQASLEDLNAEERQALLTFAAQNGRNWKDKLRAGWLQAKYPGHLQAIRNRLGPTWLNQVKLT